MEQVGQDSEEGNRPGADDDLRRIGMDATRFVDVAAQSPAQIGDALVIVGRQQAVWF